MAARLLVHQSGMRQLAGWDLRTDHQIARDAELQARVGALDPFGESLPCLGRLNRGLGAMPGCQPRRRQHGLANIADQAGELVDERLQRRRGVRLDKGDSILRNEQMARQLFGIASPSMTAETRAKVSASRAN